jgi:hypothetical protein
MLLLLALSSAPQDEPIPELLRALGDDAVEVREKASAELFALGEPARSALEKAGRDATSAEIRGRLQDVLRRLDADKRRREFKGGKVLDDLGARLTITQDKEARLLIVSFEVMNLGAIDKKLVPLRDWNLHLPHYSNSYSGAEGEIRIEQLKGDAGEGRYSSRLGCGPEPVREVLFLKPGECRTFKHSVNISSLAAGEHQVKVRFFKRHSGTPENLESNPQTFTVEK